MDIVISDDASSGCQLEKLRREKFPTKCAHFCQVVSYPTSCRKQLLLCLMQVGINSSNLHANPTHQAWRFPLSIYYFSKFPINCMDVRQDKGVMANLDSSMSTIRIVCKCGYLVDIIASSGDRFRRYTICHDISAMTYS